ncbi:MAG: DUF1553 domain-containing protein [Candidatus Sumerlaeota bacterium]|nr:DUF1553 domain-containing protein [Candidatus Sumerlaeota bacterium]
MIYNLWLYDNLKACFLAGAVVMAVFNGWGAESPIVRPFEREGGFDTTNPIDARVLAKLRAEGIASANLCSDEVFVRRVYLDVIGTLPEPKEVRAFLQDNRPDKRAVLIDALLARDEFADYWAMKWDDLLRVKAEFPINLWPNAVQAYHRWIYDSIRENKPYDQFARELLTSSGSNFRVGPVNFYRAIQGRDPSAIASAVALTFMGTRLDKWPNDQEGLGIFFSRVKYKGTAEWKEEIVCNDPAATDTLKAVFPDGQTVEIPPDQDPRQVFADWLITPKNEWFTRNIANRAWSWLMGRGVIHEPDDIRPDNPPSNPELLACLEKEQVDDHYDLKRLYRLILNSRTYQQSPIPRSDDPRAEALFAYYPVRRLEAETLADALSWIGGEGASYSSLIPEPFTFTPKNERSIDLADGSITSSFLEMFGRPPRDTGLESERNNQPSDAQRLHLLNSTDVQQKIERSPRLRAVAESAGGDPRKILDGVYLTILSRYPTPEELAAIATRMRSLAPAANFRQTAGKGAFRQSAGKATQRPLNQGEGKQFLNDLAWALINSKEFLYRH